MLKLRLEKIGTSIGVILPAEILERLDVKLGDEISAIETPAGFTITHLSPAVRQQVEAGEAFMDRYGQVFSHLSK
jgi:putative addiction module antidote